MNQFATVNTDRIQFADVPLRVAPSAIHGNGLYCSDNVPTGGYICEYEGPVVSIDDVTDFTYVYILADGKCIIGTNDAKFINDNVDVRKLTLDETRQFFEQKKLPELPNRPQNCKFVEQNGRAYVVATTDIAPGDELLIDYGYRYWFGIFIKNSLIDYGYNITTFSF